MSKGTPSMGKKTGGKNHIACRRCGKTSFHKKKGYCSSCGFGKTKKQRNYSWSKK